MVFARKKKKKQKKTDVEEKIFTQANIAA